MKIGIDARMINQSGIGRYIRGLISELQKLDHTNEYYLLLRQEEFDTVETKDNFRKVLADFKWYGIEEQIRMPKLLSSLNLDLVHLPHFNVPILYRGKFVVTIHDLIHQHFQMKRVTTHSRVFYRFKQFGYDRVFNIAINRSKKIITPSNFVKNLLNNDWNIDSNKMIVTPEAVEHSLENVFKRMTEDGSRLILKNLGIEKPYLFYLGNAHPHKNVEKLIQVFLNLSKRYKTLNLVLAGADHYFWQRIKDEVMVREDARNIIFTGFVTDTQAVAIYKNASMFVLPSLEEGFGIPILEAMACHCPVVSSNAASLPEVGGDAVLYFDPKNEKDMTDKIELVLNNKKLSQQLINKGLKRYIQFSWEKLARQTLEIYKTCE